MFFWFLGTSFVAVWFVFRDDRFDYRVLALGVVLPDIVDSVTGGVWVMHSVVASVVVLAGVMAIARRGSLRRRRWLALPIGMLLHNRLEQELEWNYYFSMGEEFVQRGILSEAGFENFCASYKDPDEFCCLFVVSPDFTNFVFLPYPED